MAGFSHGGMARFPVVLAVSAFVAVCFGQAAGQAGNQPSNPSKPPEPIDKRVFWIFPNNRTYPTLANYKPIKPGEKFKIATDDSFDWGSVLLAAALAGEGQLTSSNPSFGQEPLGYSHYFATAYTDLVIGNYMTEAVYPALLHQDPRYFRRGTGHGWSRLGYAMGQTFWTHTDAGGTQFNYSEIAGNSTAVAISTAYYPGERNVGSALSKLGSQLSVDMASNVLKEFWPDLHRKFSRHR
jgi:hypothetical protein